MARNIFSNITPAGTKAQFREAQATIPTIWEKFTQTIDSDAPSETHVWTGMLPQPREFVSGRSFQGFRDFTYTVENEEFELSILIDQNTKEDDRHNLVETRIRDMARIWFMFKDAQFATLMTSGGSTGFTSYDGVTFWNDAHVIGATTFDNNLTKGIADDTAPTVAEMKIEARLMLVALQSAQDDQAQEGYNWPALGKVLFMGDQRYEQSFKETINATLTGGGDSNPYFGGMGEVVVNPFLGTSNSNIYAAAVGDPMRMPIIYQERNKLDIQVLNSAEQIALNHGVIILARQRYRMWYGEPRRMVLDVLT